VLPHFVDAKDAVLDGEICALDERGRPRFSLIQPRIMVADAASIAAQARSKPVTLFLFDLLYLDGYDLRAVPLIERKKLLKSIVKPGGAVRLSESFEEGEHLLEARGSRSSRASSPNAPIAAMRPGAAIAGSR